MNSVTQPIRSSDHLVDGRSAAGAQHGDQRLLFGAFALGRGRQVGLPGAHSTVGVAKPNTVG